MVKHCRMTKMYKPEMKRIIFKVEDEQLGKAMAASLELEGAQRKVGRAPKGELQRQLSSWLEVDGRLRWMLKVSPWETHHRKEPETSLYAFSSLPSSTLASPSPFP